MGAIIVGFIIASMYSNYTSIYLKPLIKNHTVANAVCFLILFIITSILTLFLGKIIKKLFRASPLAFIDRIGGAVFGFIKGASIIGVLLMVINAFVPLAKSLLKNSKTAPYILYGARNIANLIGSLTGETTHKKLKKKTPPIKEKGYVIIRYYESTISTT